MCRDVNVAHPSLPKQGTPEWLALRSSCFGGSELASLIGANPYSKLKDLIASKAGLIHFNGNTATRWGSLFEPITDQITARIFSADQIWELSSVPGFCEEHRFSPDGIGVFQIKCEKVVNGVLYRTTEYLTVLVEYKAPFSRIPDNRIPKHYLPQVKAGICNFPFVDIGLFVNNVYRKCSHREFRFNSRYDMDLHKPMDECNPIAAGIIRFFQTAEQIDKMRASIGLDDSDSDDGSGSDDDSDRDDDLLEHYILGPKYVDFGALDQDRFGELLELHSRGLITADYSKCLIFRGELGRINELHHQIDIPEASPAAYEAEMIACAKAARKDRTAVGGLPWKMFVSDMIFLERDDSFMDELRPKLKEGMTILKDILKPVDGRAPDHATKVSRFYTHFENNDHYLDRKIAFGGPEEKIEIRRTVPLGMQ